MRAARLIEVGRVECEDAEIRKPEEGEVLVRNEMAAICGSDLHQVYDGVGVREIRFPSAPGHPGHEGIGEVVESRNARFKPGDRVLTCPGAGYTRCFADFQTLPERYCLPLPAYDGPAEHLLMAQQFGTTVFTMRQQSRDLVGKTVMVMGQGSAGVFFAWQAKRFGARKVIVSDLSEARLSEAHRTGADVALQARPDGEDVKAAVLEHTDGAGVDFLVEAVGRQNTFLQAVELVRPGGEILFFGMPDSADPIRINFHDFFRRKLRAYATYGTQEEHDQASFRWALDVIARGEIDVSTLVTHRVPIEDVGTAMRVANDRTDGARKVTLTF